MQIYVTKDIFSWEVHPPDTEIIKKKNMAAVCIIHIDVALNLFYGQSYFQNNKEKQIFQHINKTNFKNYN